MLTSPALVTSSERNLTIDCRFPIYLNMIRLPSIKHPTVLKYNKHTTIVCILLFCYKHDMCLVTKQLNFLVEVNVKICSYLLVETIR